MMSDHEWDTTAPLRACLQPDVDRAIFHDGERYAEAVAVCDACDVWVDCVLRNYREKLGVWGCSERARKRIRRLGPKATEAQRLEVAWRSNAAVLAGDEPPPKPDAGETPVLIAAGAD